MDGECSTLRLHLKYQSSFRILKVEHKADPAILNREGQNAMHVVCDSYMGAPDRSRAMKALIKSGRVDINAATPVRFCAVCFVRAE